MRQLQPKYRPQARIDLMDLYGYFAKVAGWKLARRFLSEFKATLDRLCTFPKLGELLDNSGEFAGMRRCRLSSQFRTTVIYYQEVENRLEVVRVVHSGRDFESALAGS